MPYGNLSLKKMDMEYFMQERKAKEINPPVSTFRKGGNLKKKKN